MKIQLLHHTSEHHSGYGAGEGTIEKFTYSCPCGKGTIIRVKDNIPEFRDSDITIECDECRKKYGAVFGLAE